MNDELLDKLGTYFVYHNIQERHDITFEQFVKQYMRGEWN